MKMLIALVVVIIILIIFAIMYISKESFTQAQLKKSTIVGGTVASKMIFPNNSTIVRSMLGNNAETIILVHNTPFNMQVWYPVYMYAQQLANKGEKIPNIISYDLLGHGTAWIPVPDQYNDMNPKNYFFKIEEYVDDLLKIYERYVGSGKVVLCGYGSGGTIAQAFALDYPDIVKRLYILGTTIGPTTTGISDEMQYMVNWIAKNSKVTFLTMEQSFVNWNLCLWFKNNNPLICPNPENRTDDRSVYNSVEFLLASKMYRNASSETYLQIDKLMADTDLRNRWASIDVPFPVTFLVPDKDHYINLSEVKKDLDIVKKSSPNATLYVVKGKHGFPLIYPQYIFDMVSGKNMSGNNLTAETIN